MERITIHEEKEAITRQFQNTEANIALLNDIHRIKPFNDLQTVLSWSKDSGVIQKLFFEENPEAEKLSHFSKQEFVYPPHLLSLQNLLKSLKNQTGAYAKFEAKKKTWVMDMEALEVFNDRFRKFATSEEEKARWNFANAYCEYINQLRPGLSGIQKFVNAMVILKPSHEGYVLKPNWQFVFNDYRF